MRAIGRRRARLTSTFPPSPLISLHTCVHVCMHVCVRASVGASVHTSFRAHAGGREGCSAACTCQACAVRLVSFFVSTRLCCFGRLVVEVAITRPVDAQSCSCTVRLCLQFLVSGSMLSWQTCVAAWPWQNMFRSMAMANMCRSMAMAKHVSQHGHGKHVSQMCLCALVCACMYSCARA